MVLLDQPTIEYKDGRAYHSHTNHFMLECTTIQSRVYSILKYADIFDDNIL